MMFRLKRHEVVISDFLMADEFWFMIMRCHSKPNGQKSLNEV